MKTEGLGCIYRYYKGNMSYIGQTVNLSRRQGKHRQAKSDTFFHRAVRKYGIDAFEFEILEDGLPKSKLDKHERFWILRFNCISPNGYNLTSGGVKGHYISAKEKIRRERNMERFYAQKELQDAFKKGNYAILELEKIRAYKESLKKKRFLNEIHLL